MVPARISFVTLGTLDMPAMRAFFKQLDWREQDGSDDSHAMLYTAGGALMLYPRDQLAEDANMPASGATTTSPIFSLSINVESREAVDAAFETLSACGADIAKSPEDVFWGGYSGYFRDPDGNYWEVAWNPFVSFDERGALVLS